VRVREGRPEPLVEPRSSVVTAMTFSTSPEQTWSGMMFYEEVPSLPPFHLRLLLPAPIRVEGSKSAVGDEARCVYERGYLLKRVTRIVPRHRYVFEIVDQRMAIAGGVRLAGGGYALRELPTGSTRVELETRYVSRLRPRWLARRIEAAVCHAFHRHILRAMRRAVEAAPAAIAARTAPDRQPLPVE
jgi:hypothetical protein